MTRQLLSARALPLTIIRTHLLLQPAAVKIQTVATISEGNNDASDDSGTSPDPSPHTYSVTASGDSNQTVSPSGPQNVAKDGSLSETVTPVAGYSNAAALSGTCPLGSWTGTTYTSGTITGDCVMTFSSVALSKNIFITSSTYLGNLLGGVSVADAKCMSDANKPAGTQTYKALLVATNRTACTTAYCSGGGSSEDLDWVLTPNTNYTRLDW